jgi:hypothetical protein
MKAKGTRKKKDAPKREGVEHITTDDFEKLASQVRELRATAALKPPPPPSLTRVALRIDSPLIKVDVSLAVPSRLLRFFLGSLLATMVTAMVAG